MDGDGHVLFNAVNSRVGDVRRRKVFNSLSLFLNLFFYLLLVVNTLITAITDMVHLFYTL